MINYTYWMCCLNTTPPAPVTTTVSLSRLLNKCTSRLAILPQKPPVEPSLVFHLARHPVLHEVVHSCRCTLTGDHGGPAVKTHKAHNKRGENGPKIEKLAALFCKGAGGSGSCEFRNESEIFRPPGLSRNAGLYLPLEGKAGNFVSRAFS